MNQLVVIGSDKKNGLSGIEFDHIPICDTHFPRLQGSVMAVLGQTMDTCLHCSIEWDVQWKALLSENEWLGEIKEGDQIYISGPMSNLPQHNHPAFTRMEHALKLRGARVLSPIYHDTPGHDYHTLLKMAIDLMLKGTKMVMLKNWFQSNGAILEHIVGVKLNYTIYYEAPHLVGIDAYGIPFDRSTGAKPHTGPAGRS